MWCAHGRVDEQSSLLGNDAVTVFERASWRWTHQGSVALYGRSRRRSPHKILPALQLLTGPVCLFCSRSTFHSADCTSTSKCLSCRRNWAVLGRTATTSGYRTALYVGCWCLTFSIRWLTDRRKEFSFIIPWRKRDMRDFGLPYSGWGHCVAEFVVLGVSHDPSACILLSRDLRQKWLFLHLSTLVCLGTSTTEDEGNTPVRNVGKRKPCNTGGLTPHCLT